MRAYSTKLPGRCSVASKPVFSREGGYYSCIAALYVFLYFSLGMAARLAETTSRRLTTILNSRFDTIMTRPRHVPTKTIIAIVHKVGVCWLRVKCCSFAFEEKWRRRSQSANKGGAARDISTRAKVAANRPGGTAIQLFDPLRDRPPGH